VLKSLERDPGPHLIVTPASLLENWQRELRRWAPGLRVQPYFGRERQAVRAELTTWRCGCSSARAVLHSRSRYMPTTLPSNYGYSGCLCNDHWRPGNNIYVPQRQELVSPIGRSAYLSCRRRRANGTAQQPAAQQPVSIDDSESPSEDESSESSNSDSDAEDADSPASTGDAASPAVSNDAEAPFDVMLTCVPTVQRLCQLVHPHLALLP